MNINEKFKKMWEEFKEKYGAQSIVLEGNLQNLEDKMNWFEKKYLKIKNKRKGVISNGN